MIVEDESLRDKTRIFSNREEAGVKLAEYFVRSYDLLLAIPNGGLPVAKAILENTNIPEFNLLIIKRPQLPHTTEAGFGAVSPDGEILYNDQLIDAYNLTDNIIQRQVERAKNEIKKRQKLFELPELDPSNKDIILVDDGIASGFSMRCGVQWLYHRNAASVTVAVPTAPMHSLVGIEPLVNQIICLNIRTSLSFAVAAAYTTWYDLSLDEAKRYADEILKR